MSTSVGAAHDSELALLLLCTRQHFTATHANQVRTLCQTTALDWGQLATMVHTQGVAPLFWRNLQQVGLDQITLPTPIAQQLQQSTYQNIAVKAGIIAKLAAIGAFCRTRGIDVLVIKGVALDLLVYEQPWYIVHDVDLVFRPRNGSLSATTVNEVARFFWQLPGFEYEFNTHHDVTMNGVLPVDFARIWATATQILVRNEPIWVMDPVHLLITACINCGRKRFFQLKQLLAIASILEHYPALTGHAVATQARAYGCTKLVYAALRVAQTTVGCTLPAELIPQLAVPPLRAQLIDYLIRRTSVARTWQRPTPLPNGRRILDQSLLLPYATYEPAQLLRKVRNVMRDA